MRWLCFLWNIFFILPLGSSKIHRVLFDEAVRGQFVGKSKAEISNFIQSITNHIQHADKSNIPYELLERESSSLVLGLLLNSGNFDLSDRLPLHDVASVNDAVLAFSSDTHTTISQLIHISERLSPVYQRYFLEMAVVVGRSSPERTPLASNLLQQVFATLSSLYYRSGMYDECIRTIDLLLLEMTSPHVTEGGSGGEMGRSPQALSLELMGSLASSLFRLGHLSPAKDAFLRLVTALISHKEQGIVSPGDDGVTVPCSGSLWEGCVGNALSSLAACHMQLREFSEAEHAYRRALEWYDSASTEDATGDSLLAKKFLSVALFSQAKWAEGAALLEREVLPLLAKQIASLRTTSRNSGQDGSVPHSSLDQEFNVLVLNAVDAHTKAAQIFARAGRELDGKLAAARATAINEKFAPLLARQVQCEAEEADCQDSGKSVKEHCSMVGGEGCGGEEDMRRTDDGRSSVVVMSADAKGVEHDRVQSGKVGSAISGEGDTVGSDSVRGEDRGSGREEQCEGGNAEAAESELWSAAKSRHHREDEGEDEGDRGGEFVTARAVRREGLADGNRRVVLTVSGGESSQRDQQQSIDSSAESMKTFLTLIWRLLVLVLLIAAIAVVVGIVVAVVSVTYPEYQLLQFKSSRNSRDRLETTYFKPAE